MVDRRLRVFVVEDEALTRAGMEALLSGIESVQWIGSAETGNDALAQIERLAPDLVLLDISLPDMDGFEIARRLNPGVDVVFTTAYDTYAVAAFELNALDYLLKPVHADRLEQALRRATGAGTAERAAGMPESGAPLRRIFVRGRDRITPIDIGEVERLEARDDYVAVFARGARHLVHIPLTDLLDQLDPGEFVRVHRSHAVNLKFVVAFRSTGGGRLQVELRSGAKIMASRDRSQALRALAL